MDFGAQLFNESAVSINSGLLVINQSYFSFFVWPRFYFDWVLQRAAEFIHCLSNQNVKFCLQVHATADNASLEDLAPFFAFCQREGKVDEATKDACMEEDRLQPIRATSNTRLPASQPRRLGVQPFFSANQVWSSMLRYFFQIMIFNAHNKNSII
jgi:hypothetical protein